MAKFYTPILTTVERAAQAGLKTALEKILERSNELAPELSGAMESGGFVAVDDLLGQVGYKTVAGYPYVKDQHENLELNHPNGGQPKFLETAASEVDVGAYVAAAVRGEFDG